MRQLRVQCSPIWRSVTEDGDKSAALRFLKKALKRHGKPEKIITDGLRSFLAAMRDLGHLDRRQTARWLNSRAENSHSPFRRRERAMLGFRRMQTLQKLASIHASVFNHFNLERHFVNRETYRACRSDALAEWQSLMACYAQSIGSPRPGETAPHPAHRPVSAEAACIQGCDWTTHRSHCPHQVYAISHSGCSRFR